MRDVVKPPAKDTGKTSKEALENTSREFSGGFDERIFCERNTRNFGGRGSYVGVGEDEEKAVHQD